MNLFHAALVSALSTALTILLIGLIGFYFLWRM
ncbi:hypothetical protein J2782_001737 [Brucella pseudogrignonensis]|uniref:Uncharacterized protein n=1 Tax=Brucella pseudogrignonensis TaxID=419475 RepID=A0ABU1M7I9_9HYPH|nr:hypothetical protein [Brucella pseudogrignonensis]